MLLSRTDFKIMSLIYQNLIGLHDPDDAPWGQLIIRSLSTRHGQHAYQT